MTIQHLEYVVALSHTLNFTKAAAYMHITQPALSRIISSVEQELGFDVFDRSRRNIQLTPAGQTFVVAAHKSLEHYYAGVERGLNCPPEHMRPLTVSYIADAFNSDLRGLIANFRKEYPDYGITLEETRYYEVYDGLASEEWDLVLYTANLDGLPEELSHICLEPYELYVALYDGHPLADKESIRPLALAGESFIELCYHKTYSKSWNVLQSVAKVAGFVPMVAHQSSTVSASILQVQAKQGVSIVTKATMAHYAAQPNNGLTFVPLEQVPPMYRTVIWSQENAHPALKLMVDYISTHYHDPSVTHYQH